MADQAKVEPSKILNYGLWAAQLLLAFGFAMAGAMKLVTPMDELLANGIMVAGRAPELLVRFIGLSEVLGAIGLVLPAALRILPVLTPAAAAGLALVMGLAMGDHAMNGEYTGLPVNVVLGGLAAFVAWGRLTKGAIAPR